MQRERKRERERERERERHVGRHEHAQLRRHAPRQPAHVRTQRRSNSLLALAFGPFTLVLCPFRLLFELTMTSPQDVLFNFVVEAAKAACFGHGQERLDEPRKTAEEFGLAPVQESKVRKVTESVGVDGIGYSGIDCSGALAVGHGSGIVSVQNVPIPLGGVQAQVESQSDGLSPIWSRLGRIPPHGPYTPARPASHLATQQPQFNSPVFTRYRRLCDQWLLRPEGKTSQLCFFA